MIPKHQNAYQHNQITQNFVTDNQIKAENIEKRKESKYEINPLITLTDNVMVMIVKEIEYVQSLTGFKNGFLFNQKKMNIYLHQITEDLIPPLYLDLWRFINTSDKKKCKNIKTFLNKMLATKNMFLLKEFFQIYFQALENILYIQNKFKHKEFNERQLIQFSKLFSKNLCKRIIVQNQYNQFISINQKYVSIALLNRQFNLKQLEEFQDKFLSMYNIWKNEFSHLIQVAYYCLSVQFYNIPVNYLYEGYFKNTEFETQRGIPKFNIKI